jgi:arylsulfatase A-like enzyme
VFSSLRPYGFGSFDDRYTVSTALKAGGYRTALVGKYLNGYGHQPSRVTGGPSLRYVPTGYTDWYASLEPPASSGISGGTYHYDNVVYNHNGRIDDRHKGEYSTVGISRISQRLISKYARTARPFFLWASFVAPHTGLPHEPDDPRHATPARPKWVRGWFDDVITRAPGVPRGGGKIEADMSDKPGFMSRVAEPGAAARRGMLNNARQRAESLYVIDREVADIARRLKRTGEWSNTVLMFTSDNGFFLGEHRRPAGKVLGYEPSIRVPFLVTGPGMRSGERRYDPITLVDVAATILDLGNATGRMTARHPIDGTSKVPTMRVGDDGWTSPVITEGHIWRKVDRDKARKLGFVGTGQSYFGIRTARYSLIRTIRGTLELYDLADDANQMKSRHGDPAYRATKRQLLAVWEDFLRCRGDGCRAPLPEELQADPVRQKKLTVSFWRQVDRVHGY